ncbi:hypothetical protein CEUSTIGMA_g9100.t1 [Chlamydomonas eustigma]|uniref:Uncharacterized protein n=1 Tax=Chlamydomonas eustigma TaxID=1157962 RepID=A0A250XFJ0_9CHLO|nr:hypothetical protein CEUSTIGMA_g9100.t1 [Chlamydomonas eustigma]|eukprot:GAX81672.1 hypothetical protein CEUSTIGMA_g9100.t1 [Chlamydomonas eustigma]
MFTFCISPADHTDPSVMAALLRFASAYAHEGLVPGGLAMAPYDLQVPDTESDLKSLECIHRVCDLYVWLSYRFSEQFCDRMEVEAERSQCGTYIALGLERLATTISSSYNKRGTKDYCTTAQSWSGDRVENHQASDGSISQQWQEEECLASSRTPFERRRED